MKILGIRITLSVNFLLSSDLHNQYLFYHAMFYSFQTMINAIRLIKPVHGRDLETQFLCSLEQNSHPSEVRLPQIHLCDRQK